MNSVSCCIITSTVVDAGHLIFRDYKSINASVYPRIGLSELTDTGGGVDGGGG